MESDDPCIVDLAVPFKLQRGHQLSDTETWMTMLEQFLSCNFKDYIVTVTQDGYSQTVNISIRFATVEDAVWFKLRQS